MAPVIDFTGYQPPAPRVFAPCDTCSSTEHILCVRDAGYMTYVDHTGTHTLRIKETHPMRTFTGLPQDEGDYEPEDPDAARDRTRSRDWADDELAEQRAERRYERYLGL